MLLLLGSAAIAPPHRNPFGKTCLCHIHFSIPHFHFFILLKQKSSITQFRVSLIDFLLDDRCDTPSDWSRPPQRLDQIRLFDFFQYQTQANALAWLYHLTFFNKSLEAFTL